MPGPPLPYDIRELMCSLENGDLLVPDFQRADVWKKDQIEDFLDSIFNGYPVGTFLVWRTTEDLKIKQTPYNFESSERTGAKNYLLDGQQRALSIYGVLKNKLRLLKGVEYEEHTTYFDYDTKTFSIYNKKQIQELNRGHIGRPVKYVTIKPTQRSLHELIKLDGNYKLQRNRAEYDHLHPSHKVIYDDLFENFNKFAVPVSVYASENFSAAAEAFTRLNSKGTPLTIFDIMVARMYQRHPYFNLKEEAKRIKERIEEIGFGKLKTDLILRYFGACLYAGNLRPTSDKAIYEIHNLLREKWGFCKDALEKAVDYVKMHAKLSPVMDFFPNKLMLGLFIYYFYHCRRTNPQYDSRCQTELNKLFWRIGASQRYLEGQAGKMKEDLETVRKILGGGQAPRWKSNEPTNEAILTQRFSSASTLSNTLICLLANKKPLDFTGNEVILDRALAHGNKRSLHHLFPVNYLKGIIKTNEKRRAKIEPYIHSIANLCILPIAPNSAIQDKPPSEYLRKVLESNEKKTKIIGSHLISNEAYKKLLANDYTKFWAIRAKDLKRALDDKINNG